MFNTVTAEYWSKIRSECGVKDDDENQLYDDQADMLHAANTVLPPKLAIDNGVRDDTPAIQDDSFDSPGSYIHG